RDFDPNRLLVCNLFPVLCVMHEKACLEQAGVFDESLTTHEDWDLWIRLSLLSDFLHIPKVTGEYSWREDGSTMSSGRKTDFLRTMEIIHAKYQHLLRDKPHLKQWQRRYVRELRQNLGLPAPEGEETETEPEELLREAQLALERHNWPVAEELLGRLSRCYPDILETHLTLSDVLTLQGKHQEAWEVLRTARRMAPDALPLLTRLGLNCRQRGDLNGALAAYTRAWHQNPQNPEILANLSSVCLELGLSWEALGYWREALRQEPGNAELWLGLAETARRLGDAGTLEEACHQAAQLNPGHPRLKDCCRDLTAADSAPPPSLSNAASASRPAASIIIPTFNNLELTQNCLESIRQHTPRELYELMVVDNGSTDGTRLLLERLAAMGEIKTIFHDANLGFARASNQGARAARGNYLVFLNNDTLVTPGWLEELLRIAEQDPEVAAVGAKLLYPDDTVQHAGVVVSSQRLVYHIYRGFHRDHPAVNKERPFRFLTAACLLVRREAFFAAGLFDEEFYNGFEDVDLCLKLARQGHKLVYNPKCVVYHLESQTPGRFDREEENSRLLLSRWQEHLIPDEDRYYEEDGIIFHVRRQGEEIVPLMYDGNENPFWREAAQLWERGDLEEAREFYLKALKFNPYDSRRWGIMAELAELLEEAGHHREAASYRRLLARHLHLPPSPDKRGLRQAAG
ncbi:MAG: glycosyltransferase, partial [Deltaproteobacteria bacterium]|nr:glycosyltransferase [Deltaproteobacteria bacterium]